MYNLYITFFINIYSNFIILEYTNYYKFNKRKILLNFKDLLNY